MGICRGCHLAILPEAAHGLDCGLEMCCRAATLRHAELRRIRRPEAGQLGEQIRRSHRVRAGSGCREAVRQGCTRGGKAGEDSGDTLITNPA